MHFDTQFFCKKCGNSKIMVSNDVYDADILKNQFPETKKDRKMAAWNDAPVFEPKIEQIAQDEKRLSFFRDVVEKVEKECFLFPLVLWMRISEMGI